MGPRDSFDERLIWLLRVSRNLWATRDVQALLVLITDAFVEASEADRGFLLLREPGSDALVQRVGRTNKGGDIQAHETRISSIARRVAKEAKPVFATDTGSENDLADRRSVHELHLKMMVCVPLATETGVLGVIYADGRTELEGVFTHTNQRTLEMLGEHAAAALENARLFERATNDPITGLPNASYFLHQLSKVMKEARAESPGGLLLLDIDAFKRVNQAAGAEAGDRALLDLANTLQDVGRADGLVARYGSDKFAILLPPDENTRVAVRLRDVAERARAAVATRSYHGIHLSVSIGGMGFPRAGVANQTAPDLIAIVDDALAKARGQGSGRIEIID